MKTLTLLTILLLISGGKEANTSQLESPLNSELFLPENTLSDETKASVGSNQIEGSYNYSLPIYYSARITLNADNTFKYASQGCTGKNYTEGNWRREKDQVVLTSYQKYKDVETNKVFTSKKVESKKNEKLLDLDLSVITFISPDLKFNTEV